MRKLLTTVIFILTVGVGYGQSKPKYKFNTTTSAFRSFKYENNGKGYSITFKHSNIEKSVFDTVIIRFSKSNAKFLNDTTLILTK